MFGFTLIIFIALLGGGLSFLGDKIGTKVGKKKLSIFGLRPYHTSVLMTVITGILIAAVTLGTLTVVSSDVRTALFGMKKLQREINALHAESAAVQAELAAKNQVIADLDTQIKDSAVSLAAMKTERDEMNAQMEVLQARFEDANADLAATKAEFDKLAASKRTLEQEITELETATKKLQEGLVAIREGQVVFRSGEILYAGVLQAGLSQEENIAQMDGFLVASNAMILKRLGVTDAKVQALWMPDAMVKGALHVLETTKLPAYVRVCAAGNIISGEMVVSRLEMVPNRVIYEEGAEVFTEELTIDPDGGNIEAMLMRFLQEVNKKAVTDGVMPDPITGKVGTIDAATMMEVASRMRELGGQVVLHAHAKKEITVAGPVLLRMEVRPR